MGLYEDLSALGWSPAQLATYYPDLAPEIPAGTPPPVTTPAPTPAPQTTPYPVQVPIGADWTGFNGGGTVTTITPGMSVDSLAAMVPAALPGGAAALLAALGLSGGAIAAIGAGYGLTQLVGVQYPWETGAGEGFIAPWNRDIKQDEAGRWVTTSTRPDLFNGNGAGGVSTALMAGGGAGVLAASQVVKMWDTGYTTPSGQKVPGWPFAMTADGRIHTVKKSGVRVSYKPKKPIVLMPGAKMDLRQFVKFEGVIDRISRRIAKRSKSLKRA